MSTDTTSDVIDGETLTRRDRAILRAVAGGGAELVYGALRQEGTQKSLLDRMQTRTELYEVLGYHEYESKLDELFAHEARAK